MIQIVRIVIVALDATICHPPPEIPATAEPALRIRLRNIPQITHRSIVLWKIAVTNTPLSVLMLQISLRGVISQIAMTAIEKLETHYDLFQGTSCVQILTVKNVTLEAQKELFFQKIAAIVLMLNILEKMAARMSEATAGLLWALLGEGGQKGIKTPAYPIPQPAIHVITASLHQ